MRIRPSALLVLLLPAALVAQSTSRPTTGRPATGALRARLDSIARAALAAEPLPALSVAVMRGRDTLLLAAYGSADLGLAAPATPATTFRLAGPAGMMLAAGLLQQVEAGRLRLDEDVSPRIPDFPWQGRRVTLRQLMDATSGLPDFHYLGDALAAHRAVPKARDEVTALFAGLPFAHEPGVRWQWTISGFHLAGGLLEDVSGTRYADYLRERIAAPAGMRRTFYCGDRDVVPGLARGYQPASDGFRNPPLETATLYPYHASVCATAGDVAAFARALRSGRLVAAASWRAMTTAEGAAARRPNPADSTYTQGVGVRINREDGHRWIGEYGSLMGFGSAVLDFPQESLTVVALTNTGGSAVLRVARQLARATLGLAPLPASAPRRPPAAAATGTPLPADQVARYVGTYVVKLADTSGSDGRFQRTYRVFDENGRLMIQPLGEAPEPLLAQGSHVFAIASNPPARLTFAVEGERAWALTIRTPTSAGATGRRTDAPR